MNFDLPEEIKSKPWENKKSPIFKQWLNKQIQVDPKKWDLDFIAYIEKKIQESRGKKVDRLPSHQEEREQTFTRYLDVLEISEQSLKRKKVLDVGCGDGDFVISCLEKDITKEIYGTDSHLRGEAQNEEYRKHFLYKDFTDNFPVRDLDYVFSVGAISLYLDKDHQVTVEEAIKSAIRAINPKGEVRIWPIKKFLQGIDSDGIKNQERIFASTMEYLSECLDIEWRLDPTDVRGSWNDKDVWLDQVLIIKKAKAEL